MKKTTLLIAFMMIFAFTSFAQIDVSVSGSADLTFGVKLDNPKASGFSNSTSAKISFTLVEGESEKGGDADVSGYIKIGGWSASANSDDGLSVSAGGVEAKIMFPGGWVSITGADNKINYVNPIEDSGDDTEEGIASIELGDFGGFTVGLDLAPAAIEIGVFSDEDWIDEDDTEDEGEYVIDQDTGNIEYEIDDEDEDDINDEHAYGIKAKISVAIDPVTLEVAGLFGINQPEGTANGIGGKLSAAVGPASIYVAADVQLADETTMDIGGGASVTIVDGLSAALDATYNDPDAEVGDDEDPQVADGDDLDMKISVTEAGEGGIVPALGAGVAVGLNNLTTDLAWDLEITADYTLPTMKPYAGFTINSAEEKTLNVGVDLMVIEMVTLTLDYDNGDLDNSNGVVTFVTKISY